MKKLKIILAILLLISLFTVVNAQKWYNTKNHWFYCKGPIPNAIYGSDGSREWLEHICPLTYRCKSTGPDSTECVSGDYGQEKITFSCRGSEVWKQYGPNAQPQFHKDCGSGNKCYLRSNDFWGCEVYLNKDNWKYCYGQLENGGYGCIHKSQCSLIEKEYDNLDDCSANYASNLKTYWCLNYNRDTCSGPSLSCKNSDYVFPHEEICKDNMWNSHKKVHGALDVPEGREFPDTISENDVGIIKGLNTVVRETNKIIGGLFGSAAGGFASGAGGGVVEVFAQAPFVEKIGMIIFFIAMIILIIILVPVVVRIFRLLFKTIGLG